MTLHNLGYTLRRYYVDDFYQRHVAAIPAGSLVLDLGGNKTQKRGDFDIGDYDLRVIYANLVTDKRPDVQCDAAILPFPAHQFDGILCAELLEHVPDPRLVLQEVYRVLMPGGILCITVPFLYHIHADPYDYGRYTDYYWQEVLGNLGFTDISVEKQGLFWSVLADMVGYRVNALSKLGRRAPLRSIFAITISPLIGFWKKRAAKRDARLDNNPAYNRFTTGFGIACYKP
jgi:SAM-dependent methyltransferase